VAIKAVLFDTGDTLTRPIGGRWNPRFDFEEVLLRHLRDVPTERFAEAFEAGGRFLDESSSTPPRDDYHRVILAALGTEDPSRALLDDLDRPLEVPHVEPFPDVRPVLEELRARGIRMAIVTDNWGDATTVREKHDRIGLAGFFEAFAVSSELGCNKPDPRMYRTASDALDLAPAECFYLDDDPALVRAAVQLGYSGAAIRRTGTPLATEVHVLGRLEDLLPLIDSP
jgi:putative hydrolase of the HAD superfamily